MAQSDRTFPSLHNILKMLLSSHSSRKPVHEDNELPEDVDEPPDHHLLHASPISVEENLVYVKSPTAMTDRKESLLTRALKSPDLSPSEQHPSPHEHITYRSYPHSNVSGVSTAELTSDGGLTSPSLCNSPSPPLPPQLTAKPRIGFKEFPTRIDVVDPSENTVEANLGRKRCITFACGRKAEEIKPQPESKNATVETAPTDPPKRKTTLTFVCPVRQPEMRRERSPCSKIASRSRLRGSPAPTARKPSPEQDASSNDQKTPPANKPRGIPTSGLGTFESSEATRFHEFASSVSEDEDWVAKPTEYTGKITLSDCMKKENEIRRLGEEAEEEAQDEEDEVEDVPDDDSTVHDFSDDGNESDNEAGFAESDDSDDGSEYEFWAPSTTAATSPQTLDVFRHTVDRRDSNSSIESLNGGRNWLPALARKGSGARRSKPIKMRPGTPNLPDSTDFVCGTLDEDRPLEAAYKSCMEQRRQSKQIVIPQDIDPSFPTTDPEDNDDLDEFSKEDTTGSVGMIHKQFAAYNDEALRGRQGGQTRKLSPRHSPKRMLSPPPRRQGRLSPKRLRSPPPPTRPRSPSNRDRVSIDEVPSLHPGLNISGLVQRPQVTRTKSLPRTPNPFFTSLDKSYRWTGIIPLKESPERETSRTREVHTRGPIDIVEGLEKKRQKRKEKYWRQHCRRAAKEQMERRPIPGKGAERMKELGLEVAERFRAYGVSEDAQLVLSV